MFSWLTWYSYTTTSVCNSVFNELMTHFKIISLATGQNPEKNPLLYYFIVMSIEMLQIDSLPVKLFAAGCNIMQHYGIKLYNFMQHYATLYNLRRYIAAYSPPYRRERPFLRR